MKSKNHLIITNAGKSGLNSQCAYARSHFLLPMSDLFVPQTFFVTSVTFIIPLTFFATSVTFFVTNFFCYFCHIFRCRRQSLESTFFRFFCKTLIKISLFLESSRSSMDNIQQNADAVQKGLQLIVPASVKQGRARRIRLRIELYRIRFTQC